jgi:hypothetical protein
MGSAVTQDEASSDNVPIDRTNIKGDGYRRRKLACQMTKEEWLLFDEMKSSAREQPAVTGWHGITYTNKEGERTTEQKNGFRMDFCKSWRTGKGCARIGHQVSCCKELYPSGVPGPYQPKTDPAQFANQATTLAITQDNNTSTNDNIFADAQRALAADLIQGLSAIGYEIRRQSGRRSQQTFQQVQLTVNIVQRAPSKSKTRKQTFDTSFIISNTAQADGP